MSLLQATHGHIVDLRRHTNIHLYWRGRYGPAERYELWLHDPAGWEHQFTIHTRTLLARRGHEVTLLADAHAVRAIVNWSTGMRASWLGDVGLLILPPATLSYFLTAAMVRYVIRHRRAAVIQRALREMQRPGSGHRNVARYNGQD